MELQAEIPGIGLFGYLRMLQSMVWSSPTPTSRPISHPPLLREPSSPCGDARDKSAITNCKVENSSVKGSDGSVSIGGILGAIDYRAMALSMVAKMSIQRFPRRIMPEESWATHRCIRLRASPPAAIADASRQNIPVPGNDRHGRHNLRHLLRELRIDPWRTVAATRLCPRRDRGICGGSGTSFFTACINSAEVTKRGGCRRNIGQHKGQRKPFGVIRI